MSCPRRARTSNMRFQRPPFCRLNYRAMRSSRKGRSRTLGINASEWWDLNPRPLGPQPSALPSCATFRNWDRPGGGRSRRPFHNMWNGQTRPHDLLDSSAGRDGMPDSVSPATPRHSAESNPRMQVIPDRPWGIPANSCCVMGATHDASCPLWDSNPQPKV